MDSRAIEPNEQDRQLEERTRALYSFVLSNTHNPASSSEVTFRLLDGYFIAHLETGINLDRAERLLRESVAAFLDGISREWNEGVLYHNADIGGQLLLRAYCLYRKRFFAGAAVWPQLRRGFLDYPYYFEFGDRSENHDILTLTLYLLSGEMWPEEQFRVGEAGLSLTLRGKKTLLTWVEDLCASGFSEWGSDEYYGIFIMALLNLHDFSRDADVRSAARRGLDMLFLEIASHQYRGTLMAASRRTYGCFRVQPQQSPACNLLSLYFPQELTAGSGGFNVNGLGPALACATSPYRPDGRLCEAVLPAHPAIVSMTHRTGRLCKTGMLHGADHLSSVTCRLPNVMMSTMNAPGGVDRRGGLGRYTEVVFQITFDPDTVILCNHPTLHSIHDDGPSQANGILAGYETMTVSSELPYWVVGNALPQCDGDIRPGFWQGNGHGPRSFGRERSSYLVFQVAPDDDLPFVHLFLPRDHFGSVTEQNGWIFLRKGPAWAGLWISSPGFWQSKGAWEDVEYRINEPTVGIYAEVGDHTLDDSFEAFVASAELAAPVFDAEKAVLSAQPRGSRQRIEVSFLSGPSAGGQPLPTAGDRFAAPWATVKSGEIHWESAGREDDNRWLT